MKLNEIIYDLGISINFTPTVNNQNSNNNRSLKGTKKKSISISTFNLLSTMLLRFYYFIRFQD